MYLLLLIVLFVSVMDGVLEGCTRETEVVETNEF